MKYSLAHFADFGPLKIPSDQMIEDCSLHLSNKNMFAIFR